MIHLLNLNIDYKNIALLGILFTYGVTFLLLKFGTGILPRDGGREYAHDGKLSAGKPRGAGFLFVLVFAVSSLLFLPLKNEMIIYVILTLAAMLTGFLDDCSKSPWGELKKGLLDFVIAVTLSYTYYNFNSSTIQIPFTDTAVTLSPIVFIVLGTVLVWASINVTNCSDGVDGLSGTLSVITLLTIYAIGNILKTDRDSNYFILIMVSCVMSYLWFNATPSLMIMGDAGSRALGLFISIAILKTGSPLLYIPAAFMLIIDGGLGLIKVFLLRFCKIRILKNTRTPLHDHVRKNSNWSNTQVVFKFAIIQLIISFTLIWLLP
ncbi:phospho-N-acetylmuramoyl-pentapeptide-transferase [Anaerocolumna cellulosilytica]|uniref:Phospho-N-acetylmuramoyl-pentapeptide-transferase n=1 Tax=Anaerocolumna cellulosilytica TaxID=433286 RepID=A0A6S6R4Y3_9FIRM|nr:phospho-N-acetylmuramoyl-pentapeptide-transferase [Anaerocolumna cellulosilytica]MBB5194275.1 phospho-N-acetylmuramoyl-pentapeptide-transferase [Anaerocolumna cellulosilytica]BCJ94512.1 phospho-N-acetylmuramoyl-pentapeptide-transferase [Anaerocolumna cellulosilytica]